MPRGGVVPDHWWMTYNWTPPVRSKCSQPERRARRQGLVHAAGAGLSVIACLAALAAAVVATSYCNGDPGSPPAGFEQAIPGRMWAIGLALGAVPAVTAFCAWKARTRWLPWLGIAAAVIVITAYLAATAQAAHFCAVM